MEAHGKNPRKSVIAILPARYAATRLEGKLLRLLGDKPLILHTLEQTKKARNVTSVLVATDDERIWQVIKDSSNQVVMTSPDHPSGSDRIAEVAENLPPHSIIVNVQGDEPLIPPGTIEKAVEVLLNDESVVMSTTCERIENYRDVISPDVVKVVTDENGFALYFSRSPVPYPRDAVKRHGTLESALQNEPNLIANYRKHTGLYVYRREFLLEFTKLPQSKLEKTEMLEQLRALENGVKIKVVEVEERSIGVDTIEDLERVKALIEGIKPENIPPEEFTFRCANLNDLPQIARVFVETTYKSYQGIVSQKYLDGLSEKEERSDFWKTYLKNGYQILVAENSTGKIVGFVDFEEMSKGMPFESRLNRLYVLPKFQRKKIGSKLFALAVKELTKRGICSMVLDTLEVNPCRSFYEKKGGTVIGFSHHKLADDDYRTLVYGWEDISQI